MPFLQQKHNNMENGTIKKLNIEDLKLLSNKIGYADDDFMIIDKVDEFPDSNIAARPNFFLLIVCMKGYMQIDINGKTHLLQANNAIICLPTMILSKIKFGPQHQIRMLGFSTNFLMRTVKQEKETKKILAYIVQNPILQLEHKGNLPDYMKCYGKLIMTKIADPPYHYRNDIIQHILSAMFFELLTNIYKNMEHSDQDQEHEQEENLSSHIFERFMGELAKDNGMHRSLNFFASRLCYSPKYVSYVVRHVSGRTATEWINEAAMEHIKQQLKFSNKSIKEIAEYFNFPNQSFFGKYVKKHLGVSPARYRNE